MAAPAEKPAAGVPKGLDIRVAGAAPKVGGKPIVKPGSVKPGVKPGKPAVVLRKRPSLGPVAKAGIGVLVLAVTVGGFFFYRIFFPAPTPVVAIKAPPIAKVVPKVSAADLLAKVSATPGKLVDNSEAAIAARQAAQAKADALANGQDAPTPTPANANVASQSVMAQANLTTDVKVNNALIEAAPAANTQFRTFVANASIGGVFQGTPSKAIINGRIVREGQVVESQLGIMFDRIDAAKKTIYFKDATGAEVAKAY
jgi:hypothetical protein